MTRNILKEGADWLQDWTTIATEESVTVYYDGLEATTKASLVDEEGRLIPGQVALRTEHTKFLFRAALVTSLGIVFKRSTKILWSGQLYQVVPNNNRYYTYNDAFMTHIVVDAKHVSD